MPKRLCFDLTKEQREELLWHRDHDGKPYLRERSAALLLLAQGVPASEVALHRLLRPRNEETVRGWYWCYRREGFSGLRISKGRGRKSAFSPCAA
jgi:hypothetical protein